MDKWQRLHSEVVFDTPYFNIRKDVCRLPSGREIDDYYVSQMSDVALVVAITKQHDIVLVEQYKHGIGDICLEIPGGFCEPESDNPLHDAQRELLEETGYVSDEWHMLTRVASSPTRSNNRIHIFLALNVQQQHEQSLDPNEHINIRLKSQHDILAAIRERRLGGVDSIAGVLLAFDWLATHKGAQDDR